MKYLAFDIEAANGYMPSSICSVGIVIANEQFDIIYRTNIWINPKTKYNLNGTRQNVGIDLHLDKALLDSSPDFSQVYRQIKQLLTDPDTLVVGHAVDADVRMLNAACDRYHLKGIDFRFVCSQLLFRLYKGEKEVRALNKIAAELGIEFQQHNSEEDAYMSMCTLKYLVEDSGLSVEELMEKYSVRYGTNIDKLLTRSVSLTGQVSKKKVKAMALQQILKYCEGVKQVSNQWEGKKFAFARSIELSNSEQLWALVDAVVSRGGQYVTRIASCNLYVKADKTLEMDVGREKRIYALQQQGQLSVVEVQHVLDGSIK